MSADETSVTRHHAAKSVERVEAITRVADSIARAGGFSPTADPLRLYAVAAIVASNEGIARAISDLTEAVYEGVEHLKTIADSV